jgi:hypothetical protein
MICVTVRAARSPLFAFRHGHAPRAANPGRRRIRPPAPISHALVAMLEDGRYRAFDRAPSQAGVLGQFEN